MTVARTSKHTHQRHDFVLLSIVLRQSNENVLLALVPVALHHIVVTLPTVATATVVTTT